VSHHPPISACHAESGNFVFWQDVRWKNKFWGKSMEIVPIGTTHVMLPAFGDHFEWNKVTSCIHNILSGQRWIEHYGEIVIKNLTDDSCHCKVNFIKAKYWSTNAHEIEGTVFDRSGKAVHRLFGKWHESIYCGGASSSTCVWRANPMPKGYEQYYGFTQFALELNEMDPLSRSLLPPTDTRFRPDQRLLEEGNIEEAEVQKQRIEQLQRERRRVLEENSLEHQPRFFRSHPSGGKLVVVVESDFVKYESRFENHTSGSIGTVVGKVKLNVGGKGLVEGHSSFGTLRKQEVDLQLLIQDAIGRTVNLDNPVLQQVLERRNEVLCVLTQKIVTTQKCVISEHVQTEEKCGGMVGIQTKTVQVSAMEDGTVIKDTNVVLEIPAATTIACGIIELYVKQDGQFEFCLLQGKHGGFEHERKVDSVYLDPMAYREFAFLDMPDGGQEISSQDGPLHVLKQATVHLERSFHPFAVLPAQQQMALSCLLQTVLFDEELLKALEQV
ncbi:hypothetical protein STEG23_029768, partial [Scotinomys teguina]